MHHICLPIYRYTDEPPNVFICMHTACIASCSCVSVYRCLQLSTGYLFSLFYRNVGQVCVCFACCFLFLLPQRIILFALYVPYPNPSQNEGRHITCAVGSWTSYVPNKFALKDKSDHVCISSQGCWRELTIVWEYDYVLLVTQFRQPSRKSSLFNWLCCIYIICVFLLCVCVCACACVCRPCERERENDRVGVCVFPMHAECRENSKHMKCACESK